MRTYRLVAAQYRQPPTSRTAWRVTLCLHEGRAAPTTPPETGDLPGGVAIDVALRGDPDNISIVGDIVRSWLDAGPFFGDWVDMGTDRKELKISD